MVCCIRVLRLALRGARCVEVRGCEVDDEWWTADGGRWTVGRGYAHSGRAYSLVQYEARNRDAKVREDQYMWPERVEKLTYSRVTWALVVFVLS